MDKKQLRQYKSTFHFGASVIYDFILKRGYGEEKIPPGLSTAIIVKKEWKQKMVPTRKGIVVGWRWLSDGIGEYGFEDGSSYTATESIFAIEIKRGMMNKIDLVLPESLTIDKDKKGWNLLAFIAPDILPDRVPTMSEKDKVSLRAEMKKVKRDSKGRWR